MTSLKEKIVEKINATNDEVLLKQIAILLSEDIYPLTEDEIKAVQEGFEDVKKGRIISNDEFQLECNSWLKK